MRTTLLFLTFPLIGCASSTAATPPPTPDFHDYVDLNQYCHDADFGHMALGYREETSWIDQVLCLSGKGIIQVDATKNGTTIKDTLLAATGSDKEIYWANFNSRVSLSNELIECPGGQHPIAVTGDEVEAYPDGATIKRGSPLCMVDGDLVYYNGPAKEDNEARRWTDFTSLL